MTSKRDLIQALGQLFEPQVAKLGADISDSAERLMTEFINDRLFRHAPSRTYVVDFAEPVGFVRHEIANGISVELKLLTSLLSGHVLPCRLVLNRTNFVGPIPYQAHRLKLFFGVRDAHGDLSLTNRARHANRFPTRNDEWFLVVTD